MTAAIKEISSGMPFWWRPQLEEIGQGIDAGHTNRRDASREVAEILSHLRTKYDKVKDYADRELRRGLRQHLDEAAEEIFEFAESNQLPITAGMRSLRVDRRTSRDR